MSKWSPRGKSLPYEKYHMKKKLEALINEADKSDKSAPAPATAPQSGDKTDYEHFYDIFREAVLTDFTGETNNFGRLLAKAVKIPQQGIDDWVKKQFPEKMTKELQQAFMSDTYRSISKVIKILSGGDYRRNDILSTSNTDCLTLSYTKAQKVSAQATTVAGKSVTGGGGEDLIVADNPKCDKETLSKIVDMLRKLNACIEKIHPYQSASAQYLEGTRERKIFLLEVGTNNYTTQWNWYAKNSKSGPGLDT